MFMYNLLHTCIWSASKRLKKQYNQEIYTEYFSQVMM